MRCMAISLFPRPTITDTNPKSATKVDLVNWYAIAAELPVLFQLSTVRTETVHWTRIPNTIEVTWHKTRSAIGKARGRCVGGPEYTQT